MGLAAIGRHSGCTLDVYLDTMRTMRPTISNKSPNGGNSAVFAKGKVWCIDSRGLRFLLISMHNSPYAWIEARPDVLGQRAKAPCTDSQPICRCRKTMSSICPTYCA